MVSREDLASNQPARVSFLARLGRPVMAHPRWPWIVALVAFLLTIPSLGSGLSFDDYHAKIFFLRPDSPIRLMTSPLDLFSFFRDPQQLTRIP